MSHRAPAVLSIVLLSTCLFFAGCETERGPSHAELEKLNRPQVYPTPSAFVFSTVDDANRVLQACGRPTYDAILPIYDKLNNGPVRRMVYHGRHDITLEFIPSHPLARVTDQPAPFPHPPITLPVTLPANSVWRFDDARMQEEDLMISRRIKVYLPCAAGALAYEY